VNALFVAFLVSSTAILSVIFGVLGAYYAINFLLSAVNPTREAHSLHTLVPHQSRMSGD
jgi:hypothetical protein